MGKILLLEPFENGPPLPVDPRPSKDFQAGHLAGFNDGMAAANARQSVLQEDVAQALIDIVFTFAEARTQILGSLGPLFQCIMDRLLPALGKDVLFPHIVERLIAAAQADSSAAMRITVHPTAKAGLIASLPRQLPLSLTIDADPTLGQGQVILVHNAQESTLDMDGLVEGIRAILAALFDETERKTQNG